MSRRLVGIAAVVVAVVGLVVVAVRSSDGTSAGPSHAARRVAAAADRLVEARTAHMRFRIGAVTGDGIVDVVTGAGQFTIAGQILVSDGRRLFTVDEDGTRLEQADAGAQVGSTAYVDLLRAALAGDVDEIGDDQYRLVIDVGDAVDAAPVRARPTLEALRRVGSRLEIEVVLDEEGRPVREVVRLPVGDVVIELSDFGVELPEIAR